MSTISCYNRLIKREDLGVFVERKRVKRRQYERKVNQDVNGNRRKRVRMKRWKIDRIKDAGGFKEYFEDLYNVDTGIQHKWFSRC